MNPPTTQASLRNLKSPAFAKQHAGGRNTHIFKINLCVAVRRMVVAENS